MLLNEIMNEISNICRHKKVLTDSVFLRLFFSPNNVEDLMNSLRTIPNDSKFEKNDFFLSSDDCIAHGYNEKGTVIFWW